MYVVGGSYRQIRVVVDVGRRVWYVAVLARVASRGVSADRLVYRTTLPALSSAATSAEVLMAAAAALETAADGL